MWKTITWENCGKTVKRLVWKNMWKEQHGKSVENNNTWEKCGRAVKKIV